MTDTTVSTTDAAISLPSAYPGKPMFLVGVTGYMKPDPRDVDTIREQVRKVLRFLRDGGNAPVSPAPPG